MKVLEVPKTEEYQHLKHIILSSEVDWTYQETPHGPLHQWHSDDIINYNGDPFLSHMVVRASEKNLYLYSTLESDYAELCNDVIVNTARHNKININQVLRVNFNMTFPSKKNRPDKPHIDHDFPHSNLLFYFTENGGKTVVQEESGDVEYTPVEDTAVVFDGLCKHYQWYPDTGRRVVMVATFI